MTRRVIGYLVAGLIAWAMLSYFVGRFDQQDATHEAILNRQFQDWRHQASFWASRLAEQRQNSQRIAQIASGLRHQLQVGKDSAATLAGLLKAHSDSFGGRAVTVADSSAYWQGAYQLQTIRAELLQGSLAKLELAQDSISRDRDRWQTLALAAQPILQKADTVAAGFRQVARCRILGFIPCASRKTSAIAGAFAGAAAVFILKP